MKILTRTTKFPYFFWSFNRAYESEIDFTHHTYKNLEVKTEYGIKSFNFYLFLLLKYVPILLILFFCITIYDFHLTKKTIMAYALAIMLALSVNFLEHMTRKVVSSAILILSIVAGYFTNDWFLIAYTIKYFLLISIGIILYLDLRLRPYSLIDENNKVVAHILLDKRIKIQ